MRMGGAVTVEDLLAVCIARNATPSTLGAQLEMLAERAHAKKSEKRNVNPFALADADAAIELAGGFMLVRSSIGDPYAQRDAAESAMLGSCAALRCLAELAAVKNSSTLKRDNSRRSALLSLAAHAPERGQGELVVQCLRAYEEWRSVSKERALAAVFAWSKRVCGQSHKDENELAQEFREGKAIAARKKASDLYADAFLLLGRWVHYWNRRCLRK